MTTPRDIDKHMSFWDHLEELRWTLVACLAAVTVTTGISFAFTTRTYTLLRRPMISLENRVELIFTGPLDAFLIRLKLALLTGIVLATPVLLGLAWHFIAPALRRREKTVIWTAIVAGTLFFCLGAVFGYTLLFFGLPVLVRLGISGPGVRHLWSLQTYLDFCVRLILAFGLVFELPVVGVALARLGALRADLLRRIRPHAAVGIFILAAVITPPDVITQIMLGLPLLLLYEATIVLIALLERNTAPNSA